MIRSNRQQALSLIGMILFWSMIFMTSTDAQEKPDRSKPPKAALPKDVKFPDYFEEVLANGLKLIVYEQHELPSVAVSLVVRGGSMYDGNSPGLASMTADLLTKGTKTRSATQIAEEIEFLGGNLGAGTGWDNSTVSLSILSKYLDKAFDVMADVVLNPTFPNEELDRSREQRLASILQRKANAGSLASIQFNKAIYGDHPYGQPPDGTEASIKALNREMMVKFHEQYFLPNNAFMVAVGDITPKKMKELINKVFGTWKKGSVPEVKFPEIKDIDRLKIQVVDRAGAVQSAILVGHVGIARNNPDFIPLSVLNTLLGGYFGSRLNLNLREDKGYTYGARSGFDSRLYRGPFSASAEVRNGVTDSSVIEFLKEIKRVCDEPIPQDELNGVKSYLTGLFPIQIETPGQVASRIVSIEMYGLGKTYYNTYNSKVNAVTSEELSRVAKKYLHPDKLVVVAAGKADLLKETLAKFGTVELFNADGETLPSNH